MEWIKRMSLKKSLFVLMLSSIVVAALLSALVFWAYTELNTAHSPQILMYRVSQSYVVEPGDYTDGIIEKQPASLIALSQVFLPVLIFVGALLLAVFLFYRLKLKEPLTILTDATARIMDNDLDFKIEPASPDELGALCAAFETMRGALLANSQALWRQAQEQKRLNAAFSHDLRNPLTVLKGSAKMARRCAPCDEALGGHLARIEAYTGRMERYVEIMSSVTRLGQLPLDKAPIRADALSAALEEAVRLIAAETGADPAAESSTHSAVRNDPNSTKTTRSIRLIFHGTETAQTILVDKSALFQIAENLAANALRFANTRVQMSLSLDARTLVLTVTDNGPGFPAKLLQNGIRPFQKGAEDAEHFGMGLYICALLCEKHGGSIRISNSCESPGEPDTGAFPSGGAQIHATLSIS